MNTIGFAPDRGSAVPLYMQLYDHFSALISSGKIQNGEKLPSRRRLMEELKLSKSTVDNAYHLLEKDGFVISRSRSGFFARSASSLSAYTEEQDFYSNPGIVINMSHQGIDIGSIPTEALSRLFRNYSYDMPSLFSFGHKYGEEELRRAISKALSELHGIEVPYDRIIIGAGTEYLLEQLVHVFPKSTVFGFENPTFARSYVAVRNSAEKVELLNSSPDAFPQQALIESGIDVLYVACDGTFPFNRILSQDQRKFILDWAGMGENRYVIEAAFDSDFCGGAGSALISRDSDRIIYIGTFSRSIASSIKVSYMVVPKKIKELFNNILPYYTCLADRICQQAIAEYIKSGKYLRHTERLKKIYEKKCSLLLSEIDKSPLKKIVKVSNNVGGTYFILTINRDANENSLRTAAAKNGVKLMPLSSCLISPSSLLPKNSFIMGFGELDDEQIKDAVRRLSEAWAN